MKDKLIVVVDDDPKIRDLISDYFHAEGNTVKGFSGSEGLFEFLDKDQPDFIVLDLMMPGKDGIQICREIKGKDRYSSIPVIMLSGKGEETFKISGLDTGADDYMVKPFSQGELEARMKAVLRRKGDDQGEGRLSIGNVIEIDKKRYSVTVNGGEVELTQAEFKILELLATRIGQVFSRQRILDYLWGEEKVVIARTVDVHIRHLREKLGEAGDLIKNIRGVGYKIDLED